MVVGGVGGVVGFGCSSAKVGKANIASINVASICFMIIPDN